MADLPVIVYTLPACVQCDATKRALAREGVPFTAVPLTDEKVAEFKAAGFLSAPIVVTPTGETWSGFRRDKIAALGAAA